MNKVLIALGLAATVALVGCNKKEQATDTDATAAASATQTATTIVETPSDQIDAAPDYNAEDAIDAATQAESETRNQANS